MRVDDETLRVTLEDPIATDANPTHDQSSPGQEESQNTENRGQTQTEDSGVQPGEPTSDDSSPTTGETSSAPWSQALLTRFPKRNATVIAVSLLLLVGITWITFREDAPRNESATEEHAEQRVPPVDQGAPPSDRSQTAQESTSEESAAAQSDDSAPAEPEELASAQGTVGDSATGPSILPHQPPGPVANGLSPVESESPANQPTAVPVPVAVQPQTQSLEEQLQGVLSVLATRLAERAAQPALDAETWERWKALWAIAESSVEPPVDVPARLAQRILLIEQLQPSSIAAQLSQIEELVGVEIVAAEDDLDAINVRIEKPITFSLNDCTVAELLQTVLDEAGLQYTIDDQRIELSIGSDTASQELQQSGSD